MVTAILEGRRTMTRRVLSKNLILNDEPDRYRFLGLDDGGKALFEDLRPEITQWIEPVKCPYGKVGDRLWVRETWADVTPCFSDADDVRNVAFRADESVYSVYGHVAYLERLGVPGIYVDKWKPSIFMPRFASRITLEITGVRVERLQEISCAECDKEGIVPNGDPNWHRGLGGIKEEMSVMLSAFETAWDKINGKKHPWSSNPFVWVVEFKRVEV